MHIQYSRSHTEEELMEILALQKQNSPTNFSEEEKQKEGFITILHSFDQLKNLNDDCPHIIAKFEGKVIGYALCMTKKFAKEIPLLTSMFENADILLKEKSYLAMGQICVSKDFRGYILEIHLLGLELNFPFINILLLFFNNIIIFVIE
ncbi:hypothetical protein PP182_05525 [Maribacter sp. PR1]|uniref:N-acetyltransferase domain-containing protein n=1 Tax=Maribacter cobaltidurans TaxID=1178778 RepID=A0ABU7IRD2_9FLAO|nr:MULTISPECIES: hypothetical protein [Maribacter]MDC6388129.1 hypothetical protein [Maribacter sp. PR1]MEE1975517.1 hypothetical protein [Maribacter cobaltidurans]